MIRNLTTKLFFLLMLFVSCCSYATEYEQALTAFYEEDYDKAYIHLKNTLKDEPNNLSGKILMGRVLLVRQFYDEAILEFNEALDSGADIALVIEPLGEALLRNNMNQEALELGQSARLRDSSKYKGELLSGHALTKLGRLEEALNRFKTAQNLSSKNTTVLNALATHHIRMGKLNDAEAIVRQSQLIDAENPMTWHLQGQIHKASDNLQDALVAFNKALSLAPEQAVSHKALTVIFVQQGEHDKALQSIEKVLLESPQDLQAMLLKGRILASLDRTEEAEAIFADLTHKMGLIADEYLNENHWLMLVKGMAAYEQKQYSQSSQDINRYLLSEPKDLQAITLLANSYVLLDQKREALILLKEKSDVVASSLELSLILCELYIEFDEAENCAQNLSELEKTFPEQVELLIVKARALAALGEHREATTVVEQTYTLQPTTEVGINLVKLYLLTERNRKALIFTDYLLKYDPENIDLLNIKVAGLIKIGDVNTAQQILNQILDKHPDHYIALYNQSSLHILVGKALQAKQQIKTLIQRNPKNQGSQILLAKAETELGNYSAAIDALKSVVQVSKNNIEAQQILLRLLRLTGQQKEALSVVNVLLRKQPKNTELVKTKAQIHTALRDFDQAKVALDALFELYQPNPRNLLVLSQLQRQAKDLNGARRSLDLAIKTLPNDKVLLFEDVKLNIYEMQLATAQSKIESLKKEYPQNSELYALAGDMFISARSPNEAQEQYAKAFEYDRNNGVALVKFYNLALKGVQQKLFENVLTETINQQPNNYYFRNLLADYLLQQGRYSQAKQHYERLEDNPSYANRAGVLNSLAIVTVEEDLAAAHQYIQASLAIDAQSVNALDTYGWVLAKQGNFDESLDVLRKAYSMDNTLLSVRYHIAYTLNKLGRVSEAKSELTSLLALNQSFHELEEAQQLLSTLQ